MAALSKLFQTLDCSCYELGHTWDPSCINSSCYVGKLIFKAALKLYFSLYFITALYKRRGKEYFKRRLWFDVLRSSAFLSVNGICFLSFFCLFRKLTGFHFFLNAFVCGIPASCLSLCIESPKRRFTGCMSFGCVFLPATAASFLALLLERETRRGALTLYLFNVALETAYRMLASRGVVPMFKNGEVLVFSLACAVYMYLAKLPHGLDKSVLSGLKFLVGPNEFPLQSTEDSTYRPLLSRPPKWPSWLYRIVKLIQSGPKHDTCTHNYSCLSYVIEGCTRSFVLGYAVNAGIRCLKSFTSIVSRPKTLIQALLHRDNAGLAMFLTGFSGSIRMVGCILRWLRNKDHPLHGTVAGFMAGLSMMFYRSSTIAMYVLSKLIEIVYFKGADKGVFPRVKNGGVLVYAVSTALAVHAIIFEAHNLRPGYYKFLLKITSGGFSNVNRRLLDVFGTNASKIAPDFWPDYDPKYTKLTKPV